MFEPDYLEGIVCPKCHQQRVYFDREVGFYCMSCGHEFSAEEVVALIVALEGRDQHTE